MPSDNPTFAPLETATLDWQDGDRPVCQRFDDVYFSTDSGVEESRYVFLQANNLPTRWQQAEKHSHIIAETGFGTGLNFLVTWQSWLESKQQHGSQHTEHLHYISAEKFPLRKADLERSLQAWPELEGLAKELIDSYPVLTPGVHRLSFNQGEVTLDLLLGDACEQFSAYWDNGWAKEQSIAVSSWYLDGFAPGKNPGMWTDELFQQIALMSDSDTHFSTFTAASHIRRKLQDGGFTVNKQPGFGPKREMIYGNFNHQSTEKDLPTDHSKSSITPWHIGTGKRNRQNKQVVIIGAGLAGCTTAEALCRRGWQVTLVEQHSTAASEASGNKQGVLYTRLSHQASTLSQFALFSYLHASRYFQQKIDTSLLQPGVDIDLCGSLHLFNKPNHQLHPLLQAFIEGTDNLAQVLDADTAKALSGIDDASAGLFFPGSGWVHPAALCKAILNSHPIELITNTGSVRISKEGESWQLWSEDEKLITSAKTVIIATGTRSSSFPNLNWLPIKTIRGQVSHLPENPVSQQLQTVLCHEGYIAPAANGEHCIGATFDLQDETTALRSGDHHKNLEQLKRSLPSLEQAFSEALPEYIAGRVGFRTASPDYLPLVGPAPNPQGFDQIYARFRKDARRAISYPGQYLEGLYINTGHGSRGLTSTPWCAEFLASYIGGQPLPTTRELSQALLPARFIIRDLMRNKR